MKCDICENETPSKFHDFCRRCAKEIRDYKQEQEGIKLTRKIGQNQRLYTDTQKTIRTCKYCGNTFDKRKGNGATTTCEDCAREKLIIRMEDSKRRTGSVDKILIERRRGKAKTTFKGDIQWMQDWLNGKF